MRKFSTPYRGFLSTIADHWQKRVLYASTSHSPGFWTGTCAQPESSPCLLISIHNCDTAASWVVMVPIEFSGQRTDLALDRRHSFLKPLLFSLQMQQRSYDSVPFILVVFRPFLRINNLHHPCPSPVNLSISVSRACNTWACTVPIDSVFCVDWRTRISAIVCATAASSVACL